MAFRSLTDDLLFEIFSDAVDAYEDLKDGPHKVAAEEARQMANEAEAEICRRGLCSHYTCTEGEALAEWEQSNRHVHDYGECAEVAAMRREAAEEARAEAEYYASLPNAEGWVYTPAQEEEVEDDGLPF